LFLWVAFVSFEAFFPEKKFKHPHTFELPPVKAAALNSRALLSLLSRRCASLYFFLAFF